MRVRNRQTVRSTEVSKTNRTRHPQDGYQIPPNGSHFLHLLLSDQDHHHLVHRLRLQIQLQHTNRLQCQVIPLVLYKLQVADLALRQFETPVLQKLEVPVHRQLGYLAQLRPQLQPAFPVLLKVIHRAPH